MGSAPATPLGAKNESVPGIEFRLCVFERLDLIRRQWKLSNGPSLIVGKLNLEGFEWLCEHLDDRALHSGFKICLRKIDLKPYRVKELHLARA